MTMDLIEHENSIKLYEKSTNGITKQCSLNQTQRSTRDHIVKDENFNLTKVDLDNYGNNFKNLLQFIPKNQFPKLGYRELIKKKCLDEVLA